MSEQVFLDKEKISLFFSKKWKQSCCPFCGHRSWDVACKQNGNLLLSSIVGEYDQETGTANVDCGDLDLPSQNELSLGEAFVTIRCRNCSYVAHFDLKGIQEEVRTWETT